MKHVSKVDLSTTNSQTSNDAPDFVRAERVWAALTRIFGNAFLREFGEKPNGTWANRIATLSDTQIRAGLKELETQGLQFPPNLSQFTAACMKVRPAHWNVKQLAAPDDPEERKKEHDKAMEYMEYLAGRSLR